jgi:hypothetical protein
MKNINVTINLRAIRKKYIPDWIISDDYRHLQSHEKHQMIEFETKMTRTKNKGIYTNNIN